MLSLHKPANSRSRLKPWMAVLLTMISIVLLMPTLGASNAMAQDGQGAGDVESQEKTEDSKQTTSERKNFLSWMVESLGPFWMLIFAALSFVMVALVMMNILQVRRDVLLPNDFVEDFEQKLNGKDFQGAYEAARNDDSFVARVLAAGMGRLSRGYPEAVEGMQEAGEDENMALEHRLSYLALIGTIAPMLGLMGTVQGMITAFEKIASSVASPKPSELADGIATALFTTLIGLGIAVPAMVFYSILKNRIQRLVLEIGMVSEGLMSRFAAVGKGGPTAGAGKPPQ